MFGGAEDEERMHGDPRVGRRVGGRKAECEQYVASYILYTCVLYCFLDIF